MFWEFFCLAQFLVEPRIHACSAEVERRVNRVPEWLGVPIPYKNHDPVDFLRRPRRIGGNGTGVTLLFVVVPFRMAGKSVVGIHLGLLSAVVAVPAARGVAISPAFFAVKTGVFGKNWSNFVEKRTRPTIAEPVRAIIS